MTQKMLQNNKTSDELTLNESSIKTDFDDNKENITVIWFDPNIGSREDTEKTKEQLRAINDYVIFLTDLDQCVTYIQSIDDEKILLITSGSKASYVLSRTASCHQIDSIFIFCMKKERYEHLLNEYSKIIGIYVKLDDLCQSIKEQVDLVNRQIQTFSFFDQQKNYQNSRQHFFGSNYLIMSLLVFHEINRRNNKWFKYAKTTIVAIKSK
jgi:hypothetical protein